jgi:hypothetical protein
MPDPKMNKLQARCGRAQPERTTAMAVTLAQAALLSQNSLQRGVIETFVQLSPVLDRIPLMPSRATPTPTTGGHAPGVAFRSVNEAYTESTGTVNQATESLVILGGDADVDRFIVQTRGNLNDQRAVQTRLKVKAASYLFQDTFFNGDVSVNTKAFDGLKKRLTGGQVIDAATNGAPVVGNGGTDAQAFFDALDALVAAVPGLDGSNGAIYANSKLLGKIRSAGRRLGGVDMVREDMTGKRVLPGTASRSSTRAPTLAGTTSCRRPRPRAPRPAPRPRSTP